MSLGCTGSFSSQFNTEDHCAFTVNWRINKSLLPHNLYSTTKHIPLTLQRPFHFIVNWCPFSFQSDKYNSLTINIKDKE